MRRAVLGVGVTSLGQIVVGVASGVQAILVAAIFGVTAGTDGFFAAYGVYSLAVLLAQSWRVTLVPRLVDSGSSFHSFNRFCGGAGLVFALTGVLFVPLGGPLASFLTGDLPGRAQDVAQEALLIMWPAAGCQLIAALSAAMLGVLGQYSRAALAYGLGSVVSIGSLVALEPSLGMTAVPCSILIGSLVTAVPLTWALVRAGWRPARSVVLALGDNARAAGLALVSSLTNVFVYLVFIISIAVATRLGEGVATIYTYAYFVIGLVTTLVGSSVMIVLAAPLAAVWDRRPESLRPYRDDVFRTGLMIVIPVAAAAAVLGEDVTGAVLGQFSDSEAHLLVVTFLVLSPSLATTVASTVPSLALFTLGRYPATAVVALVALAIQGALSLGAWALDSLVALAAAGTAASVIRMVGAFMLLYGPGVLAVCARLGRQLLELAVPAAACFALPALLLAGGDGIVLDASAFAIGALLYAAFIGFLMPPHRLLALRLLRSVRGPA